ncbi:Cell division control protein 2 homolog (p34cdc2) [Durusdinium trenchii]|uniref:Cyclin-dependent kinase 2 homolog n=2 Tax=Durusdinium trenchii TaxID=1381693 RepID=A0ABP0HT74_9DINO
MASLEEIVQAPEIGSHYEIIDKIGQGSYGAVYGAICRSDGRQVAIKRTLYCGEEGVPATTLREISVLRSQFDSGSLSHEHVVKLHDMIADDQYIWMVFERFDMDLRTYLHRYGSFQGDLLRRGAWQLFSGLAHCHQRLVLHRDLKPPNILMKMGEMRLVLADLGLAQMMRPRTAVCSGQVCTLWYRPIELLLGFRHYGPPMDVWSLGCILSEMTTRRVLFPGDSEIDTIFRIFRLLGTPSEETWPGVSALEYFSKDFPDWSNTLHIPGLSDAGHDLLEQCLQYKAHRRISAATALQHPFCGEPASIWL